RHGGAHRGRFGRALPRLPLVPRDGLERAGWAALLGVRSPPRPGARSPGCAGPPVVDPALCAADVPRLRARAACPLLRELCGFPGSAPAGRAAPRNPHTPEDGVPGPDRPVVPGAILADHRGIRARTAGAQTRAVRPVYAETAGGGAPGGNSRARRSPVAARQSRDLATDF